MCAPTEVEVHQLGDAALRALVVELQDQAARLEATRLIPSNTVPHPKPKPEHLFLHRCGGVA